MRRIMVQLKLAFAIAAMVGYVAPDQAFAKGEPEEKPRIDCSKKANKNKPACKKKSSSLTDDELYYAGYWLARAGQYEEALSYLTQARNSDDPRFLTYIGYAKRKLGSHEKAMTFYQRALAIDPNFTIARAYLGEAHLTRGDLASAKRELDEIARRKGDQVIEYRELALEIAKYEALGRS